MRRSAWSHVVLPFVPFVAGIALATWRFRADDPLGGLLIGEAGALLLIVLATVLPRWMPNLDASASGPRDRAHRVREIVGSAGAPHDRTRT